MPDEPAPITQTLGSSTPGKMTPASSLCDGRMRAMTIDPEAAEVKASGGVVVRARKVPVVPRPRYDAWSFPKGKLDAGESWEDGALREVEEEIGLRCRLG